MFSTQVPTASSGVQPNLSLFRGVMAFALILPTLQIALNVIFFPPLHLT